MVRVEDIPDSYWQAQLRVVRNRGESGDWQDLPEEEVLKLKQEHLSQSKEDQQGSIEEWIDYLASDRSSYLPDHLKYWAFAGMLRLERYEKAEKDERGAVVKQGRFPERSTGRRRSIKMFPEVNENGLKFIAKAYAAQSGGPHIYWGYNQDVPESARQTFLDALDRKNFRDAYGWAQEHIPPITDEEMQVTEGENCGWVAFSKETGDTGQHVAVTLAGKGTGWCIAGKEIAQRNYLDRGAVLHIYYTRDRSGNQTNPRVVIVEMGGKVTEVRGIEWEENVDDYMKDTDVIGNKLKELPGGKEFFATDADTKHLTAIDRKMHNGDTLTGAELAFLYELDRPIRCFGYKKDPRITELRNQRNAEEDMLIVFDCKPSQIAHSVDEINDQTRVYVGPIAEEITYPETGVEELGSKYKGIFQELRHVEHIYTKFPEGKISILEPAIGGAIKEQLIQNLANANTNTTSGAESMMRDPNFTTLPEAQKIRLVKLKISQLGLSGYPTTDQIYRRAQELGLDLCPAEVGPHLRLATKDQPLGDIYYVGMKQITRSVFCLVREDDGGLCLREAWAKPDSGWFLHEGLVFSLRK